MSCEEFNIKTMEYAVNIVLKLTSKHETFLTMLKQNGAKLYQT